MTASLEHQERMPKHLEKQAPDEYGRTVADALAFLTKSDRVLLAVRVTDGTVTYLDIDPWPAQRAIEALPHSDPFACEWHASSRELVIGSWASVQRAMVREAV